MRTVYSPNITQQYPIFRDRPPVYVVPERTHADAKIRGAGRGIDPYQALVPLIFAPDKSVCIDL